MEGFLRGGVAAWWVFEGVVFGMGGVRRTSPEVLPYFLTTAIPFQLYAPFFYISPPSSLSDDYPCMN